MKVYLGTDHAGFGLKEKVKTFLLGKGYEVEDCGAYSYEKDDDYPDFVEKVGERISKEPLNRGLIFGGSGEGEAMVANKYAGVRCALFYAPCVPAEAVDVLGKLSEDRFEILRLTREHNDANVLSLGSRFLKEEDALVAVSVFLETAFSGEERHKRRVEKIKDVESRISG